ncbi:MAG TPA: 4-hydroxy-tetrahydrodipicolinate synthase [Porticoccaceae bacterium]|nr:4-hydroxy-tetrahydrodipicolinate synthase [Porticoccaceae bacterium]HCO59781.1 4-hydroxy-tetrahydrodipicolinate synthase [Porticoccaceae bacterium]
MITGSIVALVTPMVPDTLAVDNEALKRLIDWHIGNGTDAIVAVGTTGESATLEVEEHLAVIKTCVEQAAGRIPIIAGTGANSTSEAIELTRGAQQAGADACLLVTPYYNKPTQRGLILHFQAIAEAVPVPQILYNVPGRTACDMLAETVCELARVENIIGIKEATGDIGRAEAIIAGCDDSFAVYSGDDATAVELMLSGGKGNISVTANVAPAKMHELCVAAIAGDADKARALNKALALVHDKLFVEANPIPVKWALAEMGLIAHDAIRLPLTPLSASWHGELRGALSDCGVL